MAYAFVRAEDYVNAVEFIDLSESATQPRGKHPTVSTSLALNTVLFKTRFSLCTTRRPQGYKNSFLCLAQLSKNCMMLINVKMPTSVGILTLLA